MNPYLNLINLYKLKLGIIAGGDYTFNILRPNYTQVDNTGVLIGSGSFFLEPSRDVDAEDKLRDFEFFSVCGNPYIFQYGDIIQCSAPDIPICTISQKPQEQEFLAVKTNKIGYIQDLTAIYTSVYFDFAEATRPGGEDFSEDLTSYADPKRQIVMYARSGIKEGMKFFDQTNGWVWKIDLVDQRSFIQVVHLSEPNRI